jgi:hypothetical protein
VPELATLTAAYPLIAFSTLDKLSFVFDPHVPALAPVVCKSKFNIVESAMSYPVGTTVHVFVAESSTPFQIVSFKSPTAKVASTPVGMTVAVPVTVAVPREKVASTPVGKYLDSSVTLPTLKVEETPVGVTSASAMIVAVPRAKVAPTPSGKYLDSSTTLPGLKVAETPVGTYSDSSTTLPTLKVPATPVGAIVIEDPSPVVDSAKAS